MSSSSSPLVEPLWVGLSVGLELALKAGVPLFDCEVIRFSMLFEHPPTIEAMRPAVEPLGLDLRTPTDVHHAFHLLQIATMEPPKKVVEWGGGYGGMARLGLQLWPECEWSIIDLPGPLQAQQLHLRYDDRVRLWSVDDADSVAEDADLFVSTFALSECPPAALHFVLERNWFGASTVFLAFEEDKPGFASGFSDWLDDFEVTEHPHIPGNFYGLLTVR